MAFDRACFPTRRAPPAWEMGFLQPVRVEHLFQTRYGSIVQVMPPIPQPLERRHFVVARPFAGFQCQTSVCANRDRKNVEAGPPIFRRSKPIREGQLVIRIERRRVTADATFALKDLLSSPRLLIGAIRVDRRLERVHVQRESIEGLVWQTFLYPLRIRGKHVIWAKIGDFRKTDLSRITHQVSDPAMEMSPGVVDILSILDSDQVRYLRREQDAPVPSSDRASLPLRDYERVVIGRG